MAVNLRSTAGVVVSASAAAPATFDAAGYAALTWTPVNGFDNIGQIGEVDEVGNFDSITDGRIKYRAISDPGEMSMNIADDPDDAGQVILAAGKAAGKGSAGEKISLRIEDGAGVGTYAQVLVSSWARDYGGASDVQRRVAVLPIIAGTIVEYAP